MINNKKKIAFLITGLNTGGAEIQLYRVITNLNLVKFKSIVISITDKGELGQKFIDNNIPVYVLGVKKNISVIFAAIRLYYLLKNEKPDILHMHMYHAYVFGRIVGRLAKVPIMISTIHAMRFGYLREKISKYTEKLSNVTTVVSKIVAERLIKDKIVPKNKLIVIPNGIDTNIYKHSLVIRDRKRKELNLKKNIFLWIAVGRLEKRKNYPNLLNAFSEVLKKNSDTILVIAGEGSLKDNCEKITKQLKIEKNVLFLGNRNDIPELLNAADGYVMSSSNEALPLVIQEAATTSLPIVATDIAGLKEVVIDNKTGFLVKSNDKISLSNGMLKLMKLDYEHRYKMGIAGCKYIKANYDIKNIVKKWQDLYNSFGK